MVFAYFLYTPSENFVREAKIVIPTIIMDCLSIFLEIFSPSANNIQHQNVCLIRKVFQVKTAYKKNKWHAFWCSSEKFYFCEWKKCKRRQSKIHFCCFWHWWFLNVLHYKYIIWIIYSCGFHKTRKIANCTRTLHK